MLHGLDECLVPPSPVEGNGYAADGAELPTDWGSALRRYADGTILVKGFESVFTRVFKACKEQEMRVAAARITDFEYDSYLRAF